MIHFPYLQQQFDNLNTSMESIDMQLLEKDCTPEKFKALNQQKQELTHTHDTLLQELYELNGGEENTTI